VAGGSLEPVIDSRFELLDAAKADDHLDTQRQFGRIVLLVNVIAEGISPRGRHRA